MSTRAQFEKFLDDIAVLDLTRVVSVERWPDDGSEAVLVGRGSYDPAGSPKSPVLVLNNKGTEARFSRRYSSLARMMAAPPESFFDGWTVSAARPLAPAEVLARVTLIVEDASPDSIMAVMLLLMQLHGLPPAAVPSDWIEAIDQWEREGTVEQPRTTWTALASALAHRDFSIGTTPSDDDDAVAWTETLHFLAYCLRHDLKPYAIPELPALRLWRVAQVALRQEEQTYRGWLPHAHQLQLSLPTDASGTRRLLIDGLLFVEDQPTGTAKVFYRNDRARAPLGDGFAFAAHYRPAEAGTGNDFTISVDPRAGVRLEELWHELEARETKAWEGRRPNDKPRKLPGYATEWNEPWYINDGADLIGAPRKVRVTAPDGSIEAQNGTKLTWPAIQEAIWTVFNPVKNVMVHAQAKDRRYDKQKAVALLDLRPLPPDSEFGRHQKHLMLAKWPIRKELHLHGVVPRSLNDSPTVERVIAFLINRREGEPLTLDALPRVGTWHRIELSGGFAIVTQHGLFVLDDWHDRELKALPEICETFNIAATLDNELSALEQTTIRALAAKMHEAGEQAWASHRQITALAASAGVRLADLRGRETSIPRDPDARRLREELDRQWGLDRRLTSLEQQVKSISDALKTLNEARQLAVTKFVGIFAFGPYLASNLAGQLSRLIIQYFRGAPPGEDAPAWVWWLCFGTIATAIILVLKRKTR